MHRQEMILIDLLVAGQTGFTNRFSPAAGTLDEILKSRLKFFAQNASQSRAQPVKNAGRSKPFSQSAHFSQIRIKGTVRLWPMLFRSAVSAEDRRMGFASTPATWTRNASLHSRMSPGMGSFGYPYKSTVRS